MVDADRVPGKVIRFGSMTGPNGAGLWGVAPLIPAIRSGGTLYGAFATR